MRALDVGDHVESRLSGNRGIVTALLAGGRVAAQMHVPIDHGVISADIIYTRRQLIWLGSAQQSESPAEVPATASAQPTHTL